MTSLTMKWFVTSPIPLYVMMKSHHIEFFCECTIQYTQSLVRMNMWFGIRTQLRSHFCEAVCELLYSHSRMTLFQDRWPSYVATVSTWLLMPIEFIQCRMTAMAIWNNECSDAIRPASSKSGNAFLWSVGPICSSLKRCGLSLPWNLQNLPFWNPRTSVGRLHVGA